MTISDDDAIRKYGVDIDELSAIEAQASRGILPGEPGEISVGRPLLFGEPSKMIGFKESPETVVAIDRRAKSLGMSRSGYLRDLVRKDLATA